MRLLLDTHVLVWSQDCPQRLGPKTRREILNPGNEILITPISTLELARLVRQGRLEFTLDLPLWIQQAAAYLAAGTVAISHEIAMEAYSLPGVFHADPADRLLVATARREQAVVATIDERILRYPHVRAWDARA